MINQLKSTMCVLLVMGSIALGSQVIVPKFALDVNVDYSRFYYSASEGGLEVVYSVYPSLVVLKNEEGLFRGAVEVRTVIKNKATDSIAFDHRASLAVVAPDTSNESLRKPFVAKLSFALAYGTYSMDIYYRDAQNHTRRDSIRLAFTLAKYEAKPCMSDIDLCSNIKVSTNTSDPFYKNSYEVIPNPSLLFGSVSSPVVFSYVELYNLDITMPYILKTQIHDLKGAVVLEKSRPQSFRVKNTVDVATLKVTTIISGKYKIMFILTDAAGKELAHAEKPIFIYNPNVAPSAEGAISARGAELVGMTDDELIDEFTKARYLALDQEIITFPKLTTLAGRREFLAKFWTDVEQRTRGQIEMTRSIYLQRIATANERYKVYSKEGWRTDRGRVYVLYAEPDEIERFPSSDVSRPYEIWHYNQIEGSVVFIFIDRSGFGNYMLVHSTKRTELHNDEWQQYLR
jgi:GWxTD domain-containing protein